MNTQIVNRNRDHTEDVAKKPEPKVDEVYHNGDIGKKPAENVTPKAKIVTAVAVKEGIEKKPAAENITSKAAVVTAVAVNLPVKKVSSNVLNLGRDHTQPELHKKEMETIVTNNRALPHKGKLYKVTDF